MLNKDEVESFKRDGAALIKGRFDKRWIDKLRQGIKHDMHKPRARFVRHTKDENAPGYFEYFWTWSLFKEFNDFVFNSPTSQMAAELLNANQVNLVMDNWFFRQAGSKYGAPFHHDISYFDFEGSMCVLWLPLEPVTKEEGIAWIKDSHLWNKLYLRTRFQEGHPVDGKADEVNGKTHHITPRGFN